MKYKSLELIKPVTYELEGLEVGLTSSCNFKCDYCCAYNRNDGQSLEAKEVIRILEEIPTLKRVRLSGGEVTMKFRDCVEVVAYCASRGIQTQLNSNASLLNRERIMELEAAGLTTIHISFNFISAERYSRYYNMPAAVYEKLVENIQIFTSSTKVNTVLETLLFKETQGQLSEINARAYELGVKTHEIQNGIIMSHSGWNDIPAKEQLRAAVQELIDVKPADGILYFTCMDRFAEQLGFQEQEGVYFPHCIEGKTQLHLHGNGDVLISELCHPVVIGNIYKGTALKDIFRDMPAPLRDYLDRLPCPALDAVQPL